MITGWGVVTDCGRSRAVNEDAFLAEPPLFVVADGMGGHAAGDVASWLAVETLVSLVERPHFGAKDALAALGTANRAILDAATLGGRAGMGTTVCGLALVEVGEVEHWLIFNIGDSRVYRLLGSSLTQLTVDHSEVEEMVAAGRLTRDQARGYGRRHVVTQSLGTDPGPVPDSWLLPPEAGERFLVCSDGLTGELTDEEIGVLLRALPDPQEAAEALRARALEAGGRDNVTVIVVDADSSDSGRTVDEDTAPRGLVGA